MARPRIPAVVKLNVFSVIYASVILNQFQQNLLFTKGREVFYSKSTLKEALANLVAQPDAAIPVTVRNDIVRRLRKIPKDVLLIPDAPATQV